MNASLFDEFERLAAAVLDGTATGEETHRFNAVLREFPELASVYFEQARMHAMLECRGGGRFGGQAMRTSFLPPAADGGCASKIKVRPARTRFAFRGTATRVQSSCVSLSAGDEPGKREESWRASVPASRRGSAIRSFPHN